MTIARVLLPNGENGDRARHFCCTSGRMTFCAQVGHRAQRRRLALQHQVADGHAARVEPHDQGRQRTLAASAPWPGWTGHDLRHRPPMSVPG